MMENLKISDTNKNAENAIFEKIKECVDKQEHFIFDAGAGSGKTYSLVQTLSYILATKLDQLKTHNQKIKCITYTNIAAKEIKKRLGNTDFVLVSTIHDFLWDEIKSYQKELVEIHKERLIEDKQNAISELKTEKWADFYKNIEDKERFKALFVEHQKIYYNAKDENAATFKMAIKSFYEGGFENVANFKKVIDRVLKEQRYKETIENINSKKKRNNSNEIDYTEVFYNSQISYDRLASMQFSHDTLLEYSFKLISNYPTLRKIIISKFPYILVDEYQDTSRAVVDIISLLAKDSSKDLLIGYYGDKKQKIYDSGVGDEISIIHKGLKTIKKEFNRRSASEIINVANLIRNDDLRQETIYENCPSGNVSFFNGSEKDAFIDFHKKKWNISLENKLDCLILRNEDIAHRTGFGNAYDFYKRSKAYSGLKYKELRDHTLNKEPEKLGEIQSFLYYIIDFKNKIKNSETLINSLIHKDVIKHLDIVKLRGLITQLKEIKGETIDLYLNSFFKKIESGDVNVKNTLKFFIKGDDIQNLDGVKKYMLHKLFPEDEKDTENEINSYKKKIDEFLALHFSVFDSWYNYINDDNSTDIKYHTYHGTKGDEFNNVLIIMDNDFGKIKNYFGNLLNVLSAPSEQDEENIKNARNLFYVVATRAKLNLAILYTDHLNENQENKIKTIFGEIDKTSFAKERKEEN